MKTIAEGTLDSTDTAWRLDVSQPVSADEVRQIANQLQAVANALETRRPDSGMGKGADHG
jgi:hypothetical protein